MDGLAVSLNPIPPGLWNDVVTWGGVFLTRSTFQPYYSVKSRANIQNLFPHKIFDIQTSFGTPISTFKVVWPAISVRQSRSLPVYQDIENRKNTKGSPLWNEKKFLSPISLKFYVWDPLTIRISNFGFFSKKIFFNFFQFLPMLKDPQKISTSKILIFFEKNFKNSFAGSWQILKRTKSWNLVNLVLVL